MKAVRLHHYQEHPKVEEVAEPKITGPLGCHCAHWRRGFVPHRSAHHRGTMGREIECDTSLYAWA